MRNFGLLIIAIAFTVLCGSAEKAGAQYGYGYGPYGMNSSTFAPTLMMPRWGLPAGGYSAASLYQPVPNLNRYGAGFMPSPVIYASNGEALYNYPVQQSTPPVAPPAPAPVPDPRMNNVREPEQSPQPRVYIARLVRRR
ncbi:MAG TPA: hypothetical protein VLG69_02160 [Candidatus Andersenbacteria bacterium]|nr:hypothetical protein [Candidatus Andersenbacteria bacterium]